MAFSTAQFEAATTKLTSGVTTLEGKLNQVSSKANSMSSNSFIPGFVKDAIIWAANKLLEMGKWLIKKIGECLEGVAAPVTFFFYASDWQDQVRAKASNVAGEIAPDALKATREWKGKAADSYSGAVKSQTTAATSIETLADKVSTALTASAVAGCAFYVALGVIVAQYIITAIGAIGALGSVVFSWAGAALIVGETTVSAGLIIAAVTTLAAVLAVQTQQMTVVKGEAGDNSAFPGGHWPEGTA
ncbi:hypothetical protein AB0D04_01190 [Streptomyces sp. NPDC048483]|uniref:hypothetical protein n=1 Tax=Streptomyces sp. NPDC048483 TaxID=3154927 RepID=UPI0034390BFA